MKGVRGWLLLLCINLTILDPITVLVNVFFGTDASSSQFEQYPQLFQFMLISGICRIALMVFSVYAGFSLWRTVSGAVSTAKRYFQAVIFYSMFAVFLPRVVALPEGIYHEVAGYSSLNAIFTICYVAGWYLYLNRSKRVMATYNSIEQEV